MAKTIVFVKPLAAEWQKHLFSLIRWLRNDKNSRFRKTAGCDKFPIDNLKK
jgi:hypothetical protein